MNVHTSTREVVRNMVLLYKPGILSYHCWCDFILYIIIFFIILMCHSLYNGRIVVNLYVDQWWRIIQDNTAHLKTFNHTYYNFSEVGKPDCVEAHFKNYSTVLFICINIPVKSTGFFDMSIKLWDHLWA